MIQTDEFGYYLIQELLTMDNRALASGIELSVWKDSPKPCTVALAKFENALKLSEDPEDFYRDAETIVREELPAHLRQSFEQKMKLWREGCIGPGELNPVNA
jgi:hypothetical protein